MRRRTPGLSLGILALALGGIALEDDTQRPHDIVRAMRALAKRRAG